MGSAVHFKNVVKHYGKQQILNGIDLDIIEGEYLGLVGVNGAGKTTLIKCMLDFTMIDSGDISIFNQQHSLIAARKNLTYLPEKFTPPYYLTGKDFLVYMANLYQENYRSTEVDKLLAILDLDPGALDKPVRQFSKGMSQKLGLIACLLSGKELLIMDEPMSGLDPKARAFLKQYLIELKGKGKTLFFSTHLLTDVEAICDKVAILHQGKILYSGSPVECCENFETVDFEQAYLKCIAEPG